MTKKELWLKLFSENDTALACAIHLCERFVDSERLQNSAEFIASKKAELNTVISPETVVEIFGVKE